MAQIITKFDTQTKKLEVIKDGEMVPNIMSCSFYANEDGEGNCAIEQFSRNKEDGTVERHCLYASQDKQKDVVTQIREYLQKK